MKFTLTADEAQPSATAVWRHFKRKGMLVRPEVKVWSDAPYRTTLVASRAQLHVLVEAQGTPAYGNALKDLAHWLGANRHYAELYLATSEDAQIEARMLAEIKKDGVGLLIVAENGVVTESERARNAALVVTPDPTLRLGSCTYEVRAALTKFNDVDRKDGLRDMCELVERETEKLAIRAAKKHHLTMTEAAVQKMDWSSRINTLASSQACTPGQTPIIDQSFKDDLHSFRGARNLVDHNVRGRRDNARRQKQFAERMMQGPRLLSELLRLQRGVR
jgi:hypothetical protein